MSTSDKRRALGKGLEALLPHRAAPQPVQISAAADSAAASSPSNGTPLELSIDLIYRNPFQTRSQFDEAALQELATSIAATVVGSVESRDASCRAASSSVFAGATRSFDEGIYDVRAAPIHVERDAAERTAGHAASADAGPDPPLRASRRPAATAGSRWPAGASCDHGRGRACGTHG